MSLTIEDAKAEDLTLRNFQENGTLCFRVLAYYRQTVPGGSSIVTSGFLTLVDARRLMHLFRECGFITSPRLQIKLQGRDWQTFEDE